MAKKEITVDDLPAKPDKLVSAKELFGIASDLKVQIGRAHV